MEGLVRNKSGRGCSDRAMETKRLAPQSCVVAVQARTERATRYKQLGARVVVAVGVHCVGEGMNVREVTPPRLIVIQPAFPCREFKDAISWALPVPSSWIQRVLQESLGPDVVEEKGTLAGAHCHNVLVETN